eukprot:3673741-Pyramimonas_sp.AAC.2
MRSFSTGNSALSREIRLNNTWVVTPGTRSSAKILKSPTRDRNIPEPNAPGGRPDRRRGANLRGERFVRVGAAERAHRLNGPPYATP